MKKLNHPNIVQFLGIYPEDKKMYMVTEFVDGGNLEVMLRNQPSFFSFNDLLRITMEVVSGMRLLEQKNVIHRDLAARNILIDTSKQDFTAKVSDFGMSRDTQEYYTSNSNSMFPIKWASPEVIKFNKYSTKSDVWAMGVTMWEIFTFGEIPYIGMSNKEAAEYVCGGNRLSFPSYFSPQISQIIKKCWNEDPQFRPSFKEIYEQLEDIVLEDPSKEINKILTNNNKSDTTNSESSKAYAYASPDVLRESSSLEQSSNGSIQPPEEQDRLITYENLERETGSETKRERDTENYNYATEDKIDNDDNDEIPNTSFSIQDFPLLNNAHTTNTILTSINNSLFAFQNKTNHNEQNKMQEKDREKENV